LEETIVPKGQDRQHIINDDNKAPGSSLAPKSISKDEFGRRVYTAMLAKGWTQAELGRQADLPRDSVSKYIRGVVLPEQGNLQKLAAALGMKTEELLPNIIERSIRDDIPSLELKVSSADSTRSWLKVNRLVTTTTAVKVIELLNADKVLDDDE
jgi:transcriptional regulator with XRE-family HTH domain